MRRGSQATLAAAASGDNGGVPALCEAYLAGIETQASAAFDDWFTHAEQSADAPLYRCLCVYPAGEDYLTYVNGACPQYIPATRKAYWAVRPSLSMYYMYYYIAPEAR